MKEGGREAGREEQGRKKRMRGKEEGTASQPQRVYSSQSQGGGNERRVDGGVSKKLGVLLLVVVLAMLVHEFWGRGFRRSTKRSLFGY